MKHTTFLAFATVLSALALDAADISNLQVRQQWPFSTKINVTFDLSGVSAENPADVTLRAYNGSVELDAARLDRATVGKRLNLKENRTYALTIDPDLAFEPGTANLPDFRLKVSATAVAESSKEALYKIVNLQSPYDVVDVTRAELINGERGAIVRDYARIGEGYSTSLDDVLIWTGVTNDVAYKTTHMVLRKIPAKDKTFFFAGKCNVSFTNDFYIGVFEVTQAQYKKGFGSHPAGGSNETNADFADYRPVDRMYFYTGMRAKKGDNAKASLWPSGDHTDVDDGSFFATLQQHIKLVFDLPTEAMWEFACRAGTTTDFYTGEAASEVAATNIMRAYLVNCVNANGKGKSAPEDCDLTDGTAWVGTYRPNAYGLYDMLGNAEELCLDKYAKTIGTADVVDPRGPEESTNELKDDRVTRGGSYWTAVSSCKVLSRSYMHAAQNPRNLGFRVCLYPDCSVKAE